MVIFPVSHTLAQGNLNFANLDGNRVNAPVTFTDVTGVGKGYKAQIYAEFRCHPLLSLNGYQSPRPLRRAWRLGSEEFRQELLAG